MKKYMIETRPRDTKYYIESICHQFFPNSYMSSNSDEFKVGLSPSKKIVISFIESPLKLMKNAFYFILKALFVLKIFRFFVMTLWSYRKKGLIRKISLTSKFMMPQPG